MLLWFFLLASPPIKFSYFLQINSKKNNNNKINPKFTYPAKQRALKKNYSLPLPKKRKPIKQRQPDPESSLEGRNSLSCRSHPSQIVARCSRHHPHCLLPLPLPSPIWTEVTKSGFYFVSLSLSLILCLVCLLTAILL